jgi:seryl-tRNA synthetase
VHNRRLGWPGRRQTNDLTMLDPKILRSELENVVDRLRTKNFELDVSEFSQLEERRKSLQVDTQKLQSERNSRSKAIGAAKAKGEDIQPLLDEVAELGDQLKSAEGELNDLQLRLDDLLLGIPNLPDASVPAGDSEDDNEEVLRPGARRHGFRTRGETLGRSFRHHDGWPGNPAARADPVHDQSAYSRTRLYRVLRALPGQ